MKGSGLQSYWLSFPENESFPVGFGVTAYSLDDAYALLKANGYEFHERATRVEVREGITVAELEFNHVARNMGPIVTRGVWYPALNIGFGAPLGGKDNAYKVGQVRAHCAPDSQTASLLARGLPTAVRSHGRTSATPGVVHLAVQPGLGAYIWRQD